LTQDFIGQGSYKAIDNIYKTILDAMILMNVVSLLLFMVVATPMFLVCLLFMIIGLVLRVKFNIKHRVPISIVFHLNVILLVVIVVANIGWSSGIWITLVGVIFINYFLAFDSKSLTYIVAFFELALLILLYFTYKNETPPVPSAIQMAIIICSIIFAFLIVLRLSMFADVITSSGYQQIQKETEELEKDSKHDFLTGLLNRRTIEKTLKYELSVNKERSGNTNLVVMLGDIDNFKSINDTYGHDCGDMVLKDVASALKKSFRGKDYVCRWGGEEFLIILPDTKIDFIHEVSKRLKKQINNAKLPDKSPVTMTFGMLICANGVEVDFERVVTLVDKLLYEGKQNGKDRIELEILRRNANA